MPATAVQAASEKATAVRAQSIDLLRGAVMIIMALDHTRDFFNTDAYHFSPEDLTQTNGILFFTRWITHFCAPVFVFLAGVSAELAAAKRPGLGEVSRHLITRGLWLIALEFTVLEVMWTFNFHYDMVVLQVIWATGWSMIVLAGLIWLPRRVTAVFALAMIAFHNLLDKVTPAQSGLGVLWNVLHAPTITAVGHTQFLVFYPLIPWIGVMAAGYCFAPVFRMEEGRRRRILLRLGAGLTAAFFLVRWVNAYGDPQPWAMQKSAVLTVISFFRTTKYPPSLGYLLMTLGPAILALGLLDRVSVSQRNPLRVYGRVAMFYYVCHFYLIHATAVLFSGLRYGKWNYFLHFPGALMGLPDPGFPTDWGYNLAEVYAIWLGIVAVLYFPCRWYLGVKQRHKSAWFSYL
jgi:uncharacterized membrane protein